MGDVIAEENINNSGGIVMKSDSVKKGIQQAPHRSLFNALGYDRGRDGQDLWLVL